MSKLLFELDLNNTIIEPPLEVIAMADLCFPKLASNDDWYKHYFDRANLDDLDSYLDREEDAALKIMLHYEVWELGEIISTMLFRGLSPMMEYYIEELELPEKFNSIIRLYAVNRAKYVEHRLSVLLTQYKRCEYPELATLAVAASNATELIQWFGSTDLSGLRSAPEKLIKLGQGLDEERVARTIKSVHFILELADKKDQLANLTNTFVPPTEFLSKVSKLLESKFSPQDIDDLEPKIMKLWIISFCIRVLANKNS